MELLDYMARLFVSLMCLAVLVHATPTEWGIEHCHKAFHATHTVCTFMRDHGKRYTIHNWRDKADVLMDAARYIDAHNAKGTGMMLKLTPLSDMSHDEYKSHLRPLTRRVGRPRHKRRRRLRSPSTDLPEAFTWQGKGVLPRIVTQGDCGSCFAITAGTMLNAWHARLQPQSHVQRYSFQALMDCASKYYPNDVEYCDGGTMAFPLRYAAEHHVPYETDVPYMQRGGTCPRHEPSYATLHPQEVFNFDSYVDHDPHLLQKLKGFIYHYGPVGLSIDASDRALQHYAGGIYEPHRHGQTHCTKDNVNHAVTLVGYDQEAWIFANSWSSSWGEKGYFRMRRGPHHCGMTEIISVIKSAVIK